MECVACTQCIDACDSIMERIGKPRGLIRFSSQARIAGESSRFLRPRVILYPAVIALFLGAFAVMLVGKSTADVTLLRGMGRPFYEGEAGEIVNQIRLKIQNRSGADASYQIEVAGESPAKLTVNENPFSLAAGESRIEPVMVFLPTSAFEEGKYDLSLRVSDGQDFDREFSYRLLGPRSN